MQAEEIITCRLSQKFGFMFRLILCSLLPSCRKHPPFFFLLVKPFHKKIPQAIKTKLEIVGSKESFESIKINKV